MVDWEGAFLHGSRIAVGGHPRERASAIIGLAELGGFRKETMELVEAASDNPSPRVRAASLVARRVMGQEVGEQFLLEALGDASPRVSRTAASIAGNRRVLKVTDLWGFATESPWKHVRIMAFSLLLREGKWIRLRYILESLLLKGEDLPVMGRSALDSWMKTVNRSTTPISEMDRTALLDLAKKCRHVLDDQFRKRLEFYIR
jgi:hypothetical protein